MPKKKTDEKDKQKRRFDPDKFPMRLLNCIEGKAGTRGKVTNRALAKVLDLGSDSQISDYLSGRSDMSYENLCKTADYFGVTVDYLVGHRKAWKTDEATIKVSDYIGLSDEGIEALHIAAHTTRHDDGYYNNLRLLSFIDRELKATLKRQKAFAKWLPQTKALPSIFVDLENYICGSGQIGFAEYDGKMIGSGLTIDQIFRTSAFEDARHKLSEMAKEIGLVGDVYARTWEEYADQKEALENDVPFSLEDNIDAVMKMFAEQTEENQINEEQNVEG